MNNLKKLLCQINKNYKILISVLLLLFILFEIIRMNLFYIDLINDSDIAAEYLLAKVQSGEKSFFSPNWYYSYDIRVLFLQFVASFLFLFTSNYYVVMGFTNIIWTIFYGMSYVFMLSSAKVKRENIIMTLPLVLTAFSKRTIYYMYGGGFYIPYLTWIFVCVGLLILGSRLDKKCPMYLALLSVISFLLGLGGFRYMAILFLPMFLGCSFLFFLESEKLSRKFWKQSRYFSYVIVSFISMVCSAIGFLINQSYIKSHYPLADMGDRDFVQMADLASHFQSLSASFVQAFGYNGGADLFSPRGISNCFSFLFFILFVFAVCKLYKMEKKDAIDKELSVLLFIGIACFIVICFILLFTGDIADILYKYVIHSFIFTVITIAVYLNLEKETLQKKLYLLGIICIVIVLNKVSYDSTLTSDNGSLGRRGYVNFLVEEGYTYGYASFWDCDITTFMCNNDTEVVPLWQTSTLEPYYWLARKDIFDKEYNENDEFFILLSKGDLQGFINAGHDQNGKLVYEDDLYTIYLFDGKGLDFQ